MKIAIIEDDKRLQDELRTIVEDAVLHHGLEAQVTTFDSGLEFLDNYASDFELIYLDIEMPGISGMETAKRIREVDREVPLVFVTNHVQYAIAGYDVAAFDFILKPVNQFNFAHHFNKVMQRYQQNPETKTLTIRYKNTVHTIKVSEIQYVESEAHYVYYHCGSKTYTAIETMKSVEQDLSPYGFFRCNNHYLVNLKRVDSIQKDDVIVGGVQLRMSRPRKKDFMNALTDYLAGTSR